jgi:hypothetical protein
MTKRQVEYKKVIRKQVSKKKLSERIQKLGDWRAEALSRIRTLIKQVDPKVIEEVKWIKPTNPLGTAVWSYNGLICTCETYKSHVRLTFAKGAFLKDPKGLFNSGLEGNAFRGIVIHEDDKINESALKDLVRSAITFNTAALKKKTSKV